MWKMSFINDLQSHVQFKDNTPSKGTTYLHELLLIPMFAYKIHLISG